MSGELELPKGSYDGAEVLTFLIQFKGIVLHTNVKFSEEFISIAFSQDIRYNGEGILLALVELT